MNLLNKIKEEIETGSLSKWINEKVEKETYTLVINKELDYLTLEMLNKQEYRN